MNDNIDMETSKKSLSPKEPGLQDQPLKDQEKALKDPAKTPPSAETEDESPDKAQEEEPGTFDRVYEHGRQMGF